MFCVILDVKVYRIFSFMGDVGVRNKKKILQLRPFNMANFSGGSGYLLLYAMMGWMFTLPATLLLWVGMALPLKTENGTLDYKILRRRLLRIALPICLVMFAFFSHALASNASFYSGNITDYFLANLWTASYYTLGIFFSIFFVAKMLNANNKLSKGRLFLWTVVFYVLMLIIGIPLSFLLESLGA